MRGFEYYQVPFNGKGPTRARFALRMRDVLGVGASIRKDGVTARTMHGACLLGFVALKTERATVDEVLGDYGLVHEMAHILDFGPSVTPGAASVDDVAAMARQLEHRLAEVPISDLASWFDVAPER